MDIFVFFVIIRKIYNVALLKASMATYLVTGGAGFIGTNLCTELVAQGHTVRVIDNLSVSAVNLAYLESIGVRVIVADIVNFEEMKPHFAGVDVVFHLAAMNRAQRSIEQPIAAHHVNITGTLHVLEAMRMQHVPKIIFASSSSVYAERSGLLTEESPLAPPHPYGVGKLAGEQYVRVYGDLHGIQYVILRFFSVYGPRQLGAIEKAGVVAKYLYLARENKPLPVYGSGLQLRNFTYVGDVVRGCLLAAQTPRANGQIINLANPNEVSVLELATVVREVTKTTSTIVHEPELAGDPPRNPADVSKAKQILGYEPQVGFREGIQQTLQWYDEMHGNSSARTPSSQHLHVQHR